MTFAILEEKKRSAYLHEEFGATLAERWFPGVINENFPHFVRGPKKGKPKGFLTWQKVKRGGWFFGNLVKTGSTVKRELFSGTPDDSDLVANERTRRRISKGGGK